MQSIKTRLTKTKNKIESSMQDGQDLFGFAGISKSGITQMIDRAYGYIARLSELETEFPVIILKRKLAGPLDSIKKYLDDTLGTKKEKERFDSFLQNITFIHDEIVLTYYLFGDKAIRDQAEAEALLSKARAHIPTIDKIATQTENLKHSINETSEQIESIERFDTRLFDLSSKAEDNQSKIDGAKTKATASLEVIEKYEIEAKDARSQIISLKSKLDSSEKRLRSIINEANKIKKEASDISDSAKLVAEENERNEKAISTTLTMASKFGMAASFKERKDELQKPMIAWATAFVISIFGLVLTGIFYIFPSFTSQEGSNIELTDIIVKISIIAPQIWLGWMAAKQYAYLSRIREDYSFKYASALAFEGYKKEASDVNSDLLKELLGIATMNMALNPLRIYNEDDSHHTPLSEFLGRLFRRHQKKSDAIEEPSNQRQ